MIPMYMWYPKKYRWSKNDRWFPSRHFWHKPTYAKLEEFSMSPHSGGLKKLDSEGLSRKIWESYTRLEEFTQSWDMNHTF